MVLRISSDADSRSICTIHAVTRLAWSKLSNNRIIISSSLKIRNVQVLKIKLTLLDILIEFLMSLVRSVNYEFPQIALLAS